MSREQIINFEIMHKTWARLGQAYINLGQLSEAISAFESALVEKYDRKIELKLQKTRQDKKTKDAELYLDEEKSLQHRELGNKAFQDGRWSDAIAEYSEAIRRNPKDHRCYSNRSACFSKLMEWGKALEDAEKTIELDPSFVKGYLRKARVEQFLKKYHKALETYKTGLEMCPDSDDLKQGMNEVRMAISMANYSGEVDEERQKRALQDPEIQAILQDPMLQRALQSMQEDPVAAQKLLADPSIRSKVETLVAAGVLQMR